MKKTFLKKEVDRIKELPPALQIYYISALSNVMLLHRVEHKLYKDTEKLLVKILKKAIDNLDGCFEDQITMPLRRVAGMSVPFSAACTAELKRLAARTADKTEVQRTISIIFENIKTYKKDILNK